MAQVRDDWRREFEQNGEEYVRSAIDLRKYDGGKLDTAKQWLGQRERQRNRLAEARTGNPAGGMERVPMDAESLYRRVGRLIETAPSFIGQEALTSEQMQWLGRAGALIIESRDLLARTSFDMQMNSITGPTRLGAFAKIMLTLYQVLGVAELRAPAAAQGAFIPANNTFDAFAAIAKILASAKTDVLIVDPYMDETVLTDYAGTVPDAASIRLLADQSTVKATLTPAATRWVTQFPTRSLAVRMSAPNALHDRAIFVDGQKAWTLTQSIKDFAKRSPAEIVRADDIAALKISAYESIWNSSQIIV
jgi:hypothetical protein